MIAKGTTMVRRQLLLLALILLVLFTSLFETPSVAAADLTEAKTAFRTGDYAGAIAIAKEAVEAGTWNEEWPRLLIQLQLNGGEYSDALVTYDDALRRYSNSLPLRQLGVEVYRYNNQPDQAVAEQAKIFELIQRSPARYSGSENLVAVGRYFGSRGEDARKILELFYDRVKSADPKYADAYVATAELALSKQDYSVAAEALEQAAKLDPDNPDIAYLTARAWEGSDSKRSQLALQQALELNPQHVPSLLLQVDRLIDRELYSEADDILKTVEAVNEKLPALWAYRTVLAHLRGDSEGEQEFRAKALEAWPQNPDVDFLIGTELSQKYRFAEGAAAQQRALEFEPNHLPARFQLAQDLLRLGDDETGWQLAKWAHESDGYNVVAFNLMNLHDQLKTFAVLKRGHFLVRMESREAAIYGEEVLEFLEVAADTLFEKYEVQPDAPIVVEIFPRQQDFAIRTFGLPGGDGFLGVCFGRVITANSPASQGEDPSNWKSVLWHELCHVVTLAKSKNRMPRWLSEGISVFEERQRDPSWGQQMTPTFRRMILGDDLVPISQLSGAFLSPQTPMHLQLAYFESSLAVEHLLENYGMETLKKILVDLSVGMPINETLQRYSGSLTKLDEEFLLFARAKARDFGCRFDWGTDDRPESSDPVEWQTWLETHADNYWGLRGLAAAWASKREYEQAKAPLLRIMELFPTEHVDTEVLTELAQIYRSLGDTSAEQAALLQIRKYQADGFPSLVRLMELQKEQQDWDGLSDTAKRALEINPLLPIAHELAIQANESLGKESDNVHSLQALSQMQPIDPALNHFRTAKAWLARGDKTAAKRALLAALEEAPHYRNAQKLLIELVDAVEPSAAEPPADAN